jgi:hypothetical protein
MPGVKYTVFLVPTRSAIPSIPLAGTAYYVIDEAKTLIRRTDGTYAEFGGGGGGGGASVVDSLAGNQTDAAPSVHIVKLALASKADLIAGKLDPSQLPDLNQMYRGAFTGPDIPTAEAALNIAHPTDDLGAYATIIVASVAHLYVWNGTAWVDTGVTGIWVENINGKTGPDVTLTAADVSATPASHALDMTIHVDATEKAMLEDLPELLGFNKIKIGAVIIS